MWPIYSHMTRRKMVGRCCKKWEKNVTLRQTDNENHQLDKQNMRIISSRLIDLFESASEKETENAGNQNFPTVEATWSISVQRERNARLPKLSS